MGIRQDLQNHVADIFEAQWQKRDGQCVPEAEDLALGNDAVLLDATVLYADMSGSTKLVDDWDPHFAAEIYKAFLHCAAKLIRHYGGTITAYDGDRIMAVFIGNSKNSAAAKAALRINWARVKVINPAIKKQYPSSSFQLKHVVGVDTSSLWVARTGIRGSNDLVWVGRAANYAAKLSALSDEYASYVTEDVYKAMNRSSKESNGTSMWERAIWTTMDDMPVYRSTWRWAP